jgi:hypothetical protein
VEDIVAIFIPISAIVMGIAFAMLSISLDYRKKREIYQLYHAERLAAIEKGIDVPPLPREFFEGRRGDESAPMRHRRFGLILTFLGAALTVALWGAGRHDYLWGLVPLSIGLAYLLSSFLEAREKRPRSDDSMPPGPRPGG